MSPSIRISIPTPLRAYADHQREVEVEAGTVGEALAQLVNRHSDLRRHLYDDQGALRRFVNVYRNDEDVRHLQQEGTPLSANDTLTIVPSIAGGAGTPPRRGPAQPAWATGEDGLPPLSQEELLRYSRHLILPEVGLEGQRKLKAASVLIIGAGGLGSPLALYLAAAGIGRLGLVDFDRVDESNLQRQVLYGSSSVGRLKLESAKERLLDLNPGVRVETHETRITSANAFDVIRPYDIIVDGTDNFPTRYLVNDACVLLQKPNVYGSIFRFEGQATVFDATRGPCYRCLYPDPPPPGLVPSCAEGGVLGVLPGVIGVMQGIEAIKLILGIGEPLIGRLVLFDALAMRFRELKLRKDPACPICGEHPTVRELIDYEEFCGLVSADRAAEEAATWDMQPIELAERREKGEDLTLIDVREPYEHAIAHLPGATLIPLNTLPERLSELDSSREIVLYCHHGQRSMRALELLERSGFRKLHNLRGGIDAWSREVDPSTPRY
jgi:sulfur-carrier protein adenylyltransferase/sulfurtransferase